MVTAEFAVALPALAFLILLALGAVSSATTMLRCQDAAYAAARSAARGEPAASHPEAGLEVTVRPEGRLVSATARSDIRIWGARLPAWRIRASAVAMREASEW